MFQSFCTGVLFKAHPVDESVVYKCNTFVYTCFALLHIFLFVDLAVSIVYTLVMDITLIALLSGSAISLVIYDVASRLKHQKDLADTLAKLNKTHNDLMLNFQSLSDQVSKVEMSVGIKSKQVSNTR